MNDNGCCQEAVDHWQRTSGSETSPGFRDITGYGEDSIGVARSNGRQPCRQALAGDRVSTASDFRSLSDLSQGQGAEEELVWLL